MSRIQMDVHGATKISVKSETVTNDQGEVYVVQHVCFHYQHYDGEARTFLREGQSGGSSNARQGTGDQNDGDIHCELLADDRFVDNMYVRII